MSEMDADFVTNIQGIRLYEEQLWHEQRSIDNTIRNAQRLEYYIYILSHKHFIFFRS